MLMLEKHKQYIATTTNHCSISLKKKKRQMKKSSSTYLPTVTLLSEFKLHLLTTLTNLKNLPLKVTASWNVGRHSKYNSIQMNFDCNLYFKEALICESCSQIVLGK